MSWQTPENLSADGIVDLFTGTPDGTKFLRDDGTLVTPAGGTDASALTTGTVALARGGTNADLSATGGATHFLRQASAGAAVTVGAITDGDLPAGSNAAAVSAKLPLAGGTLTGTLAFTTNTFPGDFAIGRGSSTSTGVLTVRGSNNSGFDVCSGSSASQVWLSNYGIMLQNNHTNYGGAVTIINRPSTNNIQIQGATAGSAILTGYGGGGITGFGSTESVSPGQLLVTPKAISLANSAQRTIAASATGRSGFVEIVDLTNHRVARYSINAGVPTLDSGHAQFVAGAPGAGEVGVELSSTTLRVNNGSGGALLIAINAMLAY